MLATGSQRRNATIAHRQGFGVPLIAGS